jgi:hypothetical protein
MQCQPAGEAETIRMIARACHCFRNSCSWSFKTGVAVYGSCHPIVHPVRECR